VTMSDSAENIRFFLALNLGAPLVVAPTRAYGQLQSV
jgi:hypothetical protein